MKDVIFIPAINNAPDNIEYYNWSLESWQTWSANKNIELVIMQDPVVDVSKMKPTWQRWYVLDILSANDITNFDNVLLVDGDTLIHPHAPNIFDIVRQKNQELATSAFFAVNDDLMVEWLYRSIKGYSKFWPDVELNWTSYFNCGFVIVNKTHDSVLKNITNFYEKNFEELQLMQHKTLRKGSDQTPVNYIFKDSGYPIIFLDKRWNCTHMHSRGFFDVSDGNSIFENLGYVYHFNGFEKSKRNELMRHFWQNNLQPLK